MRVGRDRPDARRIVRVALVAARAARETALAALDVPPDPLAALDFEIERAIPLPMDGEQDLRLPYPHAPLTPGEPWPKAPGHIVTAVENGGNCAVYTLRREH